MRQIYGAENVSTITVSHLESQFNSYAAKKQMVIIDEIYIKDSRERNATMGRLKNLITSQTITVNAKYQPEQEYDNYANYYMMSNHQDALPITDDARRFLVIEAPKPLPQAFYNEMDIWAKEGGAAQLLHYLQNEVDCAGFNENDRAPETKGKRDAVEVTSDPIVAIMLKLKNEPETFLKLGKDGHLPDQELYSTDDLLLIVNRYLRDNMQNKLNMNAMSFGRMLSSRGKLSRKKFSVKPGYQRAYYAVLNQAKWRAAPKAEWAAHVRKHDPAPRQSTVNGEHSNVVSLDDARARKEAL